MRALLLTVLLLAGLEAHAQDEPPREDRVLIRADTVDLGILPVEHPPEPEQPPTEWLPSPRGALFRSLAVPGWGQVYNRQYLKAPVVVGGMAVLVGVTVYSHQRSSIFREAALYLDCTADPPAAPPEFCTNPEEYASAFARADNLTAGPLTAGSARTLRDQFRRQRDLFILFTALGYGLQALDAYVAAELADFDLGEDLALTVGGAPGAPSLGLRLRF